MKLNSVLTSATLTRWTVLAGLAVGTAIGEAIPIAPITWNPVQNITGDTDVSTDGTLLNAFVLGTSSVSATTVNGVAFSPFAFPANMTTTTVANGNYQFVESPGDLVAYSNLGTGSGAFAGLSSAYKSLLGSGGSASVYDTLQLTISGLASGQEYEFEWWNNNSSKATSPYDGNSLNTSGTSTSTSTLSDNTSGAAGGLGQYDIGTFTANSNPEIISFNGTSGSDPMLNAFEIRAVPEPSTVALAALGGASLLLFRRRK